jgi:hypothetical protein
MRRRRDVSGGLVLADGSRTLNDPEPTPNFACAEKFSVVSCWSSVQPAQCEDPQDLAEYRELITED